MKFRFCRQTDSYKKPVQEVEINTLEELISLLNKEYDRTEYIEDGFTFNSYLGLLLVRQDDMDPSKGYCIVSGDDYFD